MDYARMRAIAEELMAHAPEDVWATEISGDEIIMMMSPANLHELIVYRLAKHVDRQLERSGTGLIAHGGADIEDPESGIKRRPDVMIFPESALESGEAVHPREVTAVVEVVSKSNPENDYEGKMRDYPIMGVPFYLIIDPRTGTGLVLSAPHQTPEGRRYSTRREFTFGRPSGSVSTKSPPPISQPTDRQRSLPGILGAHGTLRRCAAEPDPLADAVARLALVRRCDSRGVRPLHRA
ncbi:Uma2 family endonuclease [Kitasatospora acidiphila]|uniref:Uma2 family endonuclease n=1 Tax=Kitasatospora acidiphila TaxID=2567942 RepID=UPI0015F0E771|nr:Uma2 family endonuclease [Kitasatospora acidiphila]